MQRVLREGLWCVLALSIAWGVLLKDYPNVLSTHDWEYFYSLSLIIRSSIIQYGALPIHDPWILGGHDILANPQSRLLSPFVFTDILLTPFWANFLFLLFFTVLGYLGHIRLCQHYKVPHWPMRISALVYPLGGWFTCHFLEGHVAYAGFLAIPLVTYWVLKIGDARNYFWLCGFFSLLVLTGQLYVFLFFTVYVLIIFFYFTYSRFRPNKKWWRTFSYSTLMLAFFLSAKSTAVFSIPIYAPDRSDEAYTYTLTQFIGSFFSPVLDPSKEAERDLSQPKALERPGLGYHEVVNYISLVALFILLVSLVRAIKVKKWQLPDIGKWLIIVLFFCWIGLGWGGVFNPWTVWQKTPILNKLHIQSRFLVFVWPIWLLVLTLVLNKIWKSRVTCVFLALIAADLFVYRVMNYERYFTLYGDHHIGARLIQKDKMIKTIEAARQPELYWKPDAGTKEAYEPARSPTSVKASSDADYQGEIFLRKGAGTADIVKYYPGHIEVAVHSADSPSTFEFNTNYLGGWQVARGLGRISESPTGMLRLHVDQKVEKLELVYKPEYLPVVIILWCVGFIFLIMSLLSVFLKQKNSWLHYEPA